MVRFALVLSLALAVGAVSSAETPDPKPLAQRVKTLEARVKYLESLLGVNPPTVKAVSVAEAAPPVQATTFTAASFAQTTCTGPGCSQGQTQTGRSGPIRRLFSR